MNKYTITIEQSYHKVFKLEADIDAEDIDVIIADIYHTLKQTLVEKLKEES